MISSSPIPAYQRTWNFLPAGLLMVAWLFFNRAPLGWLLRELQQTSAFNLLLLAAGVLFLGVQAFRQRWLTWQPLQWSAAPVLLLAGSALLSALLPWLMDLEQLPVALFVLGTYGYLGLFLPTRRWQQGLVLAILLAGLLPFSLQQGTGLGFPIRLLTAKAVSHLLQYLQIAAPSSEDVIVLENGLAQVDLPCSGLKSLWTGSLFLLAATWLRGRQLGGRWLLVWVTSLGLFTLANISRVLGLVLIIEVWQQPELGQLLHVPLGLMGFITVCGLSWLLLAWAPLARLANPRTPEGAERMVKPELPPKFHTAKFPVRLGQQALPLGLALVLVGLTGLPQPDSLALATPSLTNLNWPGELQRQPLTLTPTETRFFADHPGTQVQKAAFDYKDVSGSMLLVSSNSWQSQHAPELCLVGNGFRVNKLAPKFLANAIPVHWLVLNDGTRNAAYWFQSPHHTTPNFLERIWTQVSRRDAQWVMVSLVFNQPLQPENLTVQEFTGTVHQVLAQSWQAQNQQAQNQQAQSGQGEQA